MALLTLAEYKIFSNIINTNADTRLQAIIDSANAFFLLKVKRIIEEATKEQYYDGDNSQELLLSDYPIVDITELKVNDNVIQPSDYITYAASGIIRLLYNVFTNGFQNVYIKFKCGYNPVPKDIKMAIAELVSKKYEQFDKKGNSFSSEAFMGGSLVFKDSDITETMKDVIEIYKKKFKAS